MTSIDCSNSMVAAMQLIEANMCSPDSSLPSQKGACAELVGTQGSPPPVSKKEAFGTLHVSVKCALNLCCLGR